MTTQQEEALYNMILAFADDEFILGHRMSEWTGMGPMIEEDVAFSSMSQDELGHAYALYSYLESLGFGEPDQLAFHREKESYRNAQLVELPRGDYADTIVRQLLYDAAESERLMGLRNSSVHEIRDLARKMFQEEKYHWMHDVSIVKRLALGTDESRSKIQNALDQLFPYALGLFEPYEFDIVLFESGIAPAEGVLCQGWLDRLCPLLQSFGLSVPAFDSGEKWQSSVKPAYGGRYGKHTLYFSEVVDALQILSRNAPGAQW